MFSLRSPDYDPPADAGDRPGEEEQESVVAEPAKPALVPEGPVVEPFLTYECMGYYDLVCKFARSPDFRSSLLSRNRDKDWNILSTESGRLTRLVSLLGEPGATCDEIVEAWAPEIGIVTPPPPAPMDYGPENPIKRTIKSALVNEIYYHLGFDRYAPPLMPPAFSAPYGEEFLYRKIHSLEGERTVLLTGVVYPEIGSGDPMVAANSEIAQLQDEVTKALGPFIRQPLMLASLKQSSVRYRSDGVRQVVDVVGLIRWNGLPESSGGLTPDQVKSAFAAVRSLLAGASYRWRAFPEWVVGPDSSLPGQKFAERMLREIRDFFVDALASCRRRLPRVQVVELAKRGVALEPGSFDPLDPAKIPADADEIEFYEATWQWETWNYGLYSRTRSDFEWFLRLDANTAVNTKSDMFTRVFSFLQKFYRDGGREFSRAATELGQNLTKIGIKRFEKPLFPIIGDGRLAEAYHSCYYAHPGSLNKDDPEEWSEESDGAVYIEYREAAMPAFVVDRRRMKAISDLLTL